MCHCDENLEKIKFELNIWKNMQQNVKIKVSCQNWTYNLHFVF